MSKDCLRAQRGMVFWINQEAYNQQSKFKSFKGSTLVSSVQTLNRPWLVVSNNINNLNSPTCNVVPITQEEKPSLPVHVNFDWDNKKQTILTEQIRTVDILALGSYICTLSDDIMKSVEEALMIQLGIRPLLCYSDFVLDKTVSNLEKIVSQIIESKCKSVKQTIPVEQLEDTAIKLGQMIEDLVGEAKTEDIKPIVEEKVIEKKSEPEVETKESEPDESIRPNKRNKWTKERKIQYLKDCEELSPQEVMKKYNFSSIPSVFSTKYLCKNSLQ